MSEGRSRAPGEAELAARLRGQAEARLRENDAASLESQTPEQIARTLHELRVNRIELEMQNEELRRLQGEMDATRARYFELYDLAPVGYVTLSEQGVILEANLTAATLLGTVRHALAGQPISRFIPQEDQDAYYRHRNQLRKTGAPQSCNLRMTRAGGTPFWAHLKAVVAQDAQGVPVHRVTLSDISERKRAEEERLRIKDQVNQAGKLEAIGVLVAGVAHNINNVLAAIMGTASLQEGMTSGPDDREAYQTIGTACRRGREVVRSLTQFARPSLTQPMPIELHGIIGEVLAILASTTRNRFRVLEAFAKEPLWIRGDAGSINHALMNLCLNALDAMPGGGTLTLRTLAAERSWVAVSVEDDGEGMPPGVQERVLEPFFTTKEQGTGLGLSMTHGVVRAHGGTMTISSATGRGTTVKLRFPRIPVPLQEPLVPASAPSTEPMEVLLVDDDEDVRFLVARMLRKAGHRVRTAASGEETLQDLASGPLPDLIILDQNMPRMNGAETLERIRALNPSVRVLISSGQLDIETWDCFQRPNVAVLSKPFVMDELKAQLARMPRGPAAHGNLPPTPRTPPTRDRD